MFISSISILNLRTYDATMPKLLFSEAEDIHNDWNTTLTVQFLIYEFFYYD